MLYKNYTLGKSAEISAVYYKWLEVKYPISTIKCAQEFVTHFYVISFHTDKQKRVKFTLTPFYYTCRLTNLVNQFQRFETDNCVFSIITFINSLMVHTIYETRTVYPNILKFKFLTYTLVVDLS